MLQLRLVEFVAAARLIVPVKPPREVTVRVEEPVAPEFSVKLDGFDKIEKSGFDDCAVTDTLVECESNPLVPVTVTL